MGGYKKQARRDRSSIKYKCNPVEGVSSELSDFVSKEYAPALGDDSKIIDKKSEGKSPMILSTAELIAAVGQMWDSANSLAIFHPKGNLIDSRSECMKVFGNLEKEENGWVPLSIDSKYFCVDVSSALRFSPVVQPNLEFLKVTQKMSVFESSSKMCAHSTFWRFLQSGTSLSNDTVGGGLASAGIPYELGNVYRWMTEKVPAGVRYPVGIPKNEKREVGEQCIPVDTTSCAGGFISGDTFRPSCKLATEDTNSSLDLSKSKDQSSCVSTKSMMNTGTTRSLLADYFLKDVPDMNEDYNVTRQTCSGLYADYCINSLTSSDNTYEKGQNLMDGDQFLENKRKQSDKCVVEDEYGMESHSPKNEKPHFALARQEHAFAGALAGVFVSLCLHPVDTVKTVIQSCRAEQKSICYIGRSIVSERGLTGLYRGIASNIASSAPISAVYAFTYESVKGALLPHFPKEFHSLAHCAAGGCASVGTSFIFTPSERIKQQMQVGSHYHNCWNALVGILKKGGLPSLYAGWGAVLCRNVPHSIIKFYTYESLKQMMLPSLQPGAQPNTIQTLVCGGVAGSTAALFTTPFDVVKTRLQTQIPGSTNQYSNVCHALQEIGKHEGLRGLYRGLIPRLVMYMSQGALFFTSYEFFKRVFSLEVPQLNTLRIQREQTKEGDAVSSASPFPSTAPAASSSSSQPMLHSLHS